VSQRDREDRRIRLEHVLTAIRGEADSRQLAAGRAIDALGSPDGDDADERFRLVDVAIEALRRARDAEELRNRLERIVSQLRLEGP